MLQLYKSLEIDSGMGYNREQMLRVLPLFQNFKKNQVKTHAHLASIGVD